MSIFPIPVRNSTVQRPVRTQDPINPTAPYLVPFLGAAYSRAREFTADRIGATCLDDMAGAKRGLTGLACGSQRLNKHVDSAAFVQQDEFVPPFIGFLVLIFSGYPRLTQRVMALDALFAERPALASPSFGVARAQVATR